MKKKSKRGKSENRKCNTCNKELDGNFHYEESFHGQCLECHAKYGKNYKTKRGEKMKVNLGCGKDLRKGFLNLDKKDIDLEKLLPFSDNELEEIVLQNVIEHIVNHKQLLQECYRSLKPTGSLFISTANYCSLGHRLRFCFGNDVPFRDFNHVRFFSYKMFLEEISKTNFIIEKIKGNSLTFPFLPAKYSGNVQLVLRKQEAKKKMAKKIYCERCEAWFDKKHKCFEYPEKKESEK